MNHGTTVYAIVTKQGMVICADGKAITTHNFPTPPEGFLKLMPIHKRLVVTCEGMGAFSGYCFHHWVQGVESDSPSNLETRALAATILRKIPEPFRDSFKKTRFATKQMLDYQERKGYIANFFIAHNLVLHRIIVSVDKPRGTITANTVIECDGESMEAPFKGYGAGRFIEIENALTDRNSNAHKEVSTEIPMIFNRLFIGKKLSQDELCAVARKLITLQAKANPEHVGPPFRIATLYPRHPVTVTDYRPY